MMSGSKSWIVVGVLLPFACALPRFDGNPELNAGGAGSTGSNSGGSTNAGGAPRGGSHSGGTETGGSETGGADVGGVGGMRIGGSGGAIGGASGADAAGAGAGGADAGGADPGGGAGGMRTGGSGGAIGGAGGGDAGGGAGGTGTGASGGAIGGSGGAGGSVSGGTSSGGASDGGTGATESGGTAGGDSGGASGGGVTGGGGSGGVSGEGGSGGQATGGTMSERPCDLYADFSTPCVAAYSMIRALSSTYTGPLYQVRSESSATNTGSGGTVHDIGMTADGFADADAQDAACGGTVCTVSLLYDQSGHDNHIPVAKRGRSDGGQYAAMDDFESIADADELTVGGHRVYSLYMAARQGYRSPVGQVGDSMPLGQAPQGIYMLADGTHYGTACCWDFGNVSPDPTQYGVMNTLFFGVAYWGRGAGSGPWMMADFEGGIWAGGTNPGDPGWGALDVIGPPNENNPSLRVPFALGFLKTNQTDWALRMADLQTATSITTAYAGGLPKQMNNQGAIVLGVGGDNSNNSWGTFFEGAIVAGFPSDDVEHAIMQNLKAAGYGQ